MGKPPQGEEKLEADCCYKNPDCPICPKRKPLIIKDGYADGGSVSAPEEKPWKHKLTAWMKEFIDNGEDLDPYWQNSLIELIEDALASQKKELREKIEQLPLVGDNAIDKYEVLDLLD